MEVREPTGEAHQCFSNKLFGDKQPPKSPDWTSPSVNSERGNFTRGEAQNEETIDELANCY